MIGEAINVGECHWQLDCRAQNFDSRKLEGLAERPSGGIFWELEPQQTLCRT